MKLEDIDHLFKIMAAEAAERGDDSLLPGAVVLSADSFCRIPHGSPISCTNILHGIRYRGVRTNVARDYEDKVLNRAEAGERGEPYFDLDAQG
jgi:hypothetical protein